MFVALFLIAPGRDLAAFIINHNYSIRWGGRHTAGPESTESTGLYSLKIKLNALIHA